MHIIFLEGIIFIQRVSLVQGVGARHRPNKLVDPIPDANPSCH
jgi:hypothetical protein